MKAQQEKSLVAKKISEVTLNFLEGENEGVEIKVGNKLPRTLTLGRSEECDIFLGEKKISRKHCQIIVSLGNVVLKDLQSTNGTFINKSKVSGEVEIKSGDLVQVGTTIIKVAIEDFQEIARVEKSTEQKTTMVAEDIIETIAAVEEPDAPIMADDFSGDVSKIEEYQGKNDDEFNAVPAAQLAELPPLIVDETKSKPVIKLDDPKATLNGEDPDEMLATLPKVKETSAVKNKSSSSAQKPLSGSLSAMGLADLLQSMAQNQKSGVLAIKSRQDGDVIIVSGQIYNAKLGDVEGLKALYRILAWTEGDFEFLPLTKNEIKETKQVIEGKMEALLMEGFRQIDELAKLKSRLPQGEASLELCFPLKANLAKLHPKVLEIVQLIWNEKSYQRVLDQSPFSDLETAKMVYYLKKKKFIFEM